MAGSTLALETRLNETMSRRIGRACLYLPSGRFALYLALRHWFRPGDRVLMSPVNDDVIVFVVLAAGLRPVMAPVRWQDGNIDAQAVPEQVWRGLAGVITTNLYGLPDQADELRRRCDRYGITLIEDAAHAIGSTVAGRPIGTFGAASAFSLSKHVGAMGGGYLALEDPSRRRALERLRDDLLSPRVLGRDVMGTLKPLARSSVRRLRLVRPVWRTMRALRLVERGAYRMALRKLDLKRAVAAVAEPGEGSATDAALRGLMAFDPWVRVDLRDYRIQHGPLLKGTLALRMRHLEADLDRRRPGTARLAARDEAAEGLRAVRHEVPALFRVPLLVRDREAMVAALERRGVVTGYIYDPPLDDYVGPEFADPSPSPGAGRWFASHVLPVDPLQAVRFCRLLDEEGARPAVLSSHRHAAASTGPAIGIPGSAGADLGAPPRTGNRTPGSLHGPFVRSISEGCCDATRR